MSRVVAAENRFELVAEKLDVAPLVAALEAQPELWDAITDRQVCPGSPHAQTRAIHLRTSADQTLASMFDQIECVDLAATDVLGHLVRPLLDAFFSSICQYPHELGRVMIVELPAGAAIDSHMDEGHYADYYDRFHVCLKAEPGNVFTVESDSFVARPGEAWWFNHKRVHTVVNASELPRWHLIFDVVAPAYRDRRGLCFQRERASKGLFAEGMAMFESHRVEIAHYPDIPLCLDEAAYFALETAGILRTYTARLNGVLVGYCVFYVRHNVRYMSSLQACQDALFVDVEHRKGRVGYQLIRFTERMLKTEGVQVVYQHTKAGEKIRAALAKLQRDDVGQLLEHMEYELVDLIYAKRLDRVK